MVRGRSPQTGGTTFSTPLTSPLLPERLQLASPREQGARKEARGRGRRQGDRPRSRVSSSFVFISSDGLVLAR